MIDLTTIVVLLTIGAFFIGALVSWIVKDYVDSYIDNAAYAKAISHPEMLNEDGTVDRTELLTVMFDRPEEEEELEEE
tara:strand:- start:155 stop:388 length:234 start_codon:yes stop_codon:yes gene_type:complete